MLKPFALNWAGARVGEELPPGSPSPSGNSAAIPGQHCPHLQSFFSSSNSCFSNGPRFVFCGNLNIPFDGEVRGFCCLEDL